MCGKPAVPNISPSPRERGDGIFHQPARLHDVDTFRVYRHRFAEQIVEAKADVFHHHKGHKAGTEQQQHGFDNLYPVVASMPPNRTYIIISTPTSTTAI